MANDHPEKHVDETIDALAAIYAAHSAEAGILQRFADRFTAVLGHPVATAIILALILCWVIVNLFLPRTDAPDAFRFLSWKSRPRSLRCWSR
jgi:uncharacterized membrane protein